jgi:hypothetical protein
MTKWLVIVESNCKEPAKEDEFNRWYNEIHLHDVLETLGVVRATRYERIAPEEGQAKYVALYEVEADDLGAVMNSVEENIARKASQGRMSPLLEMTSTSSYRHMISLER